MSTLQVFEFAGARVRTAGTPEEPLFCASDVCTVLDVANASQACARLDEDETELVSVQHTTGQKHVTFVTESGLYSLIMGSRKPEAKAFKRWVTSEVLPSIRKTGSYGIDPAKALTDPATLRQLLLENVEKVIALQGEVAEARPKVEVYDRLVDTGDTVGFREACKLIKAATGANEAEVRAFMIFRRWIQRLGGRLAPASYGQDHGYVTVRDREVTTVDGGSMVVPELRITQRGVVRSIEVIKKGSAA